MPGPLARLVIVGFWLVMSALVVRRDVLPYLGFGDLNYRSVLATRAIEEPSRWILKLNQRTIGWSQSSVRPLGNGAYLLASRTTVNSDLFGMRRGVHSPINVESSIFINPMGRLDQFEVAVTMESARLKLRILGRVESDAVAVTLIGLGGEPQVTRYPIDPDALLLDSFGPLDRLPGLSVGRKWTTRMVNPLAAMPFAGNLLGGETFVHVHHEVTAQSELELFGETYACYVVEHRHNGSKGTTWVRREDGRVLRQEVPLGPITIVMEADLMPERPFELLEATEAFHDM